jgi:hypothetical protein
MMDADGFQRIVEYRADDLNGFDAEVRREPMRGNHQVYASQYHYQQPTIKSFQLNNHHFFPPLLSRDVMMANEAIILQQLHQTFKFLL